MKACKDHVLDTGPSGTTGHTGTDSSTMTSRIERYMTWEATIGENIMYRSTTPLQVLISLAVDDGVSSRGHRTNIFKSNYAYVGIWTGSHATYDSQTVLDYAGTYNSGYTYTSPIIAIPTDYLGYTSADYYQWTVNPGEYGTTTEEGAVSKYQICYSILLLLVSYFY